MEIASRLGLSDKFLYREFPTNRFSLHQRADVCVALSQGKKLQNRTFSIENLDTLLWKAYCGQRFRESKI
jgi:hypothetical protein